MKNQASNHQNDPVAARASGAKVPCRAVAPS